MNLHKFSTQRGQPSINAAVLDDNFAKLKPLQQGGADRQYSVIETPGGWQLKLFPNLQLIEVERCDGKKMRVLGTGWYD